MKLGVLKSFLEAVPQYRRLVESLAQPQVNARAQVISDATPFVLSTLWQSLELPVLVIVPRTEDARVLHEQASIWSDQAEDVIHYPETETLPFERLVSDADTIHQRLRTLFRLTDRDRPPPLMVASATAIAQKAIDRQVFLSSSHELKRGQRIELEQLLGQWRRMGYRIEPAADAPGLASRRGGIIDIFPVSADMPVRIELWGDEIDSIRQFDPATQRSTTVVDSVTVIPAAETLPGLADADELRSVVASIDVSNCTEPARDRISEETGLLVEGHEVEDLGFYAGLFNNGSVLDYFGGDALLVVYRPSEVLEAARSGDQRAADLRDVKEKRGELPLRFPSPNLHWSEVEDRAKEIRRRLEVGPWGAEELTHSASFALPFTSAPGFFGNTKMFVEDVADQVQGGNRVVAITSVPKRLHEILEDHGVSADEPSMPDEAPAEASVTVLQAVGAGLNEGYVLSTSGSKLVVYGDAEIFGVTKQRRASRRRAVRREGFLSELSPGDYVVHVEHGIGRFLGTGRTPRDEGEREYLIVQYAAGDKLYVPMDHLDRVTPYFAAMDRPPHLTRLGTQEWNRTKERVQRSAREMASELLALYASRELAEGRAYSQDTPWQMEMEASFPYEETPDQQSTIEEVKVDMERARPMDRLVCGDVGYGKTEIGLRAAFKAVMDGCQVAVLVPTTVLAQQHYATFAQRLRAYPVNVEVLSRFRTEREQRQIVEGIADGSVDVCIGTHRLIQRDVSFKNLGLVIIDEEQRFGVGHKERLKQMRHEVDILTMTATPIPRTLHLSLSGVRDMSTIDTPPEERLPIKTYVSEFSDELITEAIRREIDRQGQVFFLHNRVHNIDYMAGYIRRLVPEAEVGVGHGQMPEEQLEQTMIDFAEGKMDVLVCTTIIESGLDIPNVNTLIVNRSDAFGLAQLYQLRGRVGRGSRRAYTYLLIPESKSLTEPAEKRLKTMLAATELGAGFRIAMKDLEIRGTGNILGSEQSGHIHSVGFDLYTRLLSEAVEAIRAQREAGVAAADAGHDGASPDPEVGFSAVVPASVELGIPANLPGDYVSDLTTRLSIYRRLVGIGTLESVASMEEELLDRFGPMPWQVRNLLYVVRLRLLATRAEVQSIRREESRIVLQLTHETGGAGPALQRRLAPGVTVGHMQIRLELSSFPKGWETPLTDTLEHLLRFKEQLAPQLADAEVQAGD